MSHRLAIILVLISGCGGGARIDTSNGGDGGPGTLGPSSGGRCRPGDPPAVVATGDVTAIALDAEFVYFSGDVGLRRVRKSGGPVDSYSRASGSHSAIALTDDRIYFADDGRSFIGSVPKTGFTSEPVVLAMRTGVTWSLNIRDSWLYVAHTTTDGLGVEVLERISLTDGIPTPLFSSSTNGVAMVRAALAGEDVVFSLGDDPRVLSVPQSGGPVRERFSNVMVNGITSYGDTAYITVHGPLTNGIRSGIVSVHPTAAPEVNELPLETMILGAVATDGESVYVIDVQERAIQKVSPKPGSSLTKVTSPGIPTPLMAVDESCVYFIDRVRPSLSRVAK